MLTVSSAYARYGLVVMLVAMGVPAYSKPVEIKSPNRDIVVSLDTSAAGVLTYSVRYRGKPAVAPSALGILVDDKNLGQNVSLGRPTTRRFEETYATRGVHSMASNKYQEAIFPVTGGAVPTNWNLEVRVFDDGVAYRYRVAGPNPHRIAGESSEWKLPSGSTLWYQSDKNKDYEAPFVQSTTDQPTVGSTIAAPATAKLPGETGYVMMTEANQIQYSDMTLEVSGPQTFKAIFSNNRQGWTAPGEIVSPWRVTVVTRDLNGLVNTDILHNLCPPPAPELAKADWIQPGRTTWHWMVTGPPQLEQQRQWVDQTKQLGFEYYLIDDGWKRWKDGDKDAWTCLKEVVSYATSQNVRIFAWVNSDELRTESARTDYFKRANAAGLVGLKIDFPHPADTEWVQWYDDTLRDTARYKLMVNFHGAVKPTGRERTWPHELTREAIRGRENYKQTGLHDATLPFVRYVQGHADFTPVELRMDKIGSASWAHEIAQAIVYTSPLLCYSGRPEDYLNNPAREIIKAIPATWDETIVLPGSEIGKVGAYARRKGDTWFIGVVNGDAAGTLPLDLKFLGKGDYQIEQFADTAERKDGYKASTNKVTRKDRFSIDLRANGGFIARIILLSEYGIAPVNNPIHLNRLFRENGLIQIREERGLELLDPGASKAFVVADHQIAHVYINDKSVTEQVKTLLKNAAGIELVLDKEEQKKHHINHERSGDLVLVAKENSWFTYYFWLDDAKAPDYARVVDIHKKPGYDPVEMFMTSKLRAGYKLLRKKAGFRYVMDVIPLDATLVKGSHGRTNVTDEYKPILVTSKPVGKTLHAPDVFEVIWESLTD